MTNQTNLRSNPAIFSSAPAAVRPTFRKLSLASAVALVVAAGWSAPQAQAQPLWVEGRVLVQFRAGLPQKEQDKILQAHGGKAQGQIHESGVHLVEVPPNAEDAVAQALSHNPHVKFAEKDMLVEPGFTPNDPSCSNGYSSSWHLPKIGAPTAWDWNPTMGGSVTIAILDTGVDPTHPDLVGQLVPGWNVYSNNADTSDVHNHGTWVAGTAAATTNNGVGVASVAGQARIMPVRIADANAYAYWSTVASGIYWAADHGANIANISYNGVSGSSSVQSAAQYLRSKGGVVVVAAGNSSGLESIAPSDALLSVSSTNGSDTRSGFSSYGDYVDLAAPGESILTTARGGGYATVQGTSFSSPVVAGVAAMMMDANSALTPAQIDSILKSTAGDLGTAGWDQYYGFGRVNAAAAVEQAVKTIAIDTQPPAASIAAPTGGTVVKGLVPVDVTATDNTGVGRVELFVNNVKVGEDTGTPFGFSWDTTAIKDGTATLYVKAYDVAGNLGQSQAVSVTVDNPDVADTAVPTVKIGNPAGGAKVTGTNVSITIDASDNVAVAKTTCVVDGQVLGQLLSSSSSVSLKCNWNIKKVAVGAHTISATAEDTAGNKSTTSIQVTK